jgi:hypothetical protein
MGIVASSIYDGEARYASHTRVNRLVYEFTQADLAALTSATADVQINGKVHNIYVDATRCTVGSGATTGSFQLLSDLTDGAGSPALYPYHMAISGLNYSATSPSPYHYQTSEGAASADGTQSNANHLVVAGGGTVNGGAMDDVCAWTGLVCGTVQIKVATSSAWGAGTGSLFVVIIYE